MPAGSRSRGKRDDPSALRRAVRASLVVPGTSVTLARSTPAIDIETLDGLVAIAEKYESVIVEIHGAHGSAFVLWDNGMLYRYSPPSSTSSVQKPAPSTTLDSTAASESPTAEPTVPTKRARAPGARRKPRA